MNLENLYRKLNRKAMEMEAAARQAKVMAETVLPEPLPEIDTFKANLFRERVPFDYRPPSEHRHRGTHTRSVNNRSLSTLVSRTVRKPK